ncbi:putative transporter [Armadillidium nasatum]|uniref:Putative transporter n=1 Tax=Armadillidium nasatum TaxID=96803 RepID=A0A5N5SRU3_9CRUS|nr:putative transporter [Armadillidium nasatum]
MSLGLAISAILTLLSPLCSDVSPYLLAVNRFFIGICYGPNPAIYQCLFAAWSPEDELGILTTVAYSGSLVGGMLCLVLSGWLSENLGWRSIFYVSGALVLLLPPLWIFLVRNTPGDHPWLSNYERELLKDNMNIKTQKDLRSLHTKDGIPPLVLLGIIFADCDQTTVIVLWIILGFFLSGTMLSCVLTTIDLAPNHTVFIKYFTLFTAAVNGMMALSTLAGSIEPSVTSAFIKTGNGWDKTFYLTIAISVVSCILFLLFMTAEPQPWNFSEDQIMMGEPQPWNFSEDKRESIASNGDIEGIDESKVNDGEKHHSPLPFKLTDRKASIFTPY